MTAKSISWLSSECTSMRIRTCRLVPWCLAIVMCDQRLNLFCWQLDLRQESTGGAGRKRRTKGIMTARPLVFLRVARPAETHTRMRGGE